MARHRAEKDFLCTIERCVASVRDQAEAAGVALDLILSANPALATADRTRLEELGRALLHWAVGEARKGDRLIVRLEAVAGGMLTLEIAEQATEHGAATSENGSRQKNEWAPQLEHARTIAAKAGGRLSVSRSSDSGFRIQATLRA
jgi:hypothetical protein